MRTVSDPPEYIDAIINFVRSSQPSISSGSSSRRITIERSPIPLDWGELIHSSKLLTAKWGGVNDTYHLVLDKIKRNINKFVEFSTPLTGKLSVPSAREPIRESLNYVSRPAESDGRNVQFQWAEIGRFHFRSFRIKETY